jgi:hypothetical protein
MSRPRQRVCLQDGLKLDLNRLGRKGFVRHGANIGGRGITWTHSYWGEIATGFITADMSVNDEGRFRIQLGQPRPADYACFPSAPFQRPAMVLHVPGQKPPRVCALEAKWRDAILQ